MRRRMLIPLILIYLLIPMLIAASTATFVGEWTTYGNCVTYKKSLTGDANSELKTCSITPTTTTDATPTTVYTFAVPDESICAITVTTLARDVESGTSAERGMWVNYALVFREGAGNATLQGSVQQPAAIETTTSLDTTISVSSTNAIIQVTGHATLDLRWNGDVDLKCVTTSS